VQVDLDTVGSYSLLTEAEIVTCVISIMEELGFKNFTLKVNDRDIFTGLPNSVISAIDKLPKIGREAVKLLLKGQNYSEFQAEDILKKVTNSLPTKKINDLFDLLKKTGVPPANYAFDPSLARGLDYYTGLIFELEVEGYVGGSVGGGGRYDKLVGTFSDNNLPAVGFSFGLDRIMEALEELKLLPQESSQTQVLVTIFNEDLLEASLEATSTLRNQGIDTEIYLDPEAKLDKQLKYADVKKIPYVIVLGPEEVNKKVVTLKDLSSGDQKEVKIASVRTAVSK
jgi:histidyl-tRNA synthetase